MQGLQKPRGGVGGNSPARSAPSGRFDRHRFRYTRGICLQELRTTNATLQGEANAPNAFGSVASRLAVADGPAERCRTCSFLFIQGPRSASVTALSVKFGVLAGLGSCPGCSAGLKASPANTAISSRARGATVARLRHGVDVPCRSELASTIALRLCRPHHLMLSLWHRFRSSPCLVRRRCVTRRSHQRWACYRLRETLHRRYGLARPSDMRPARFPLDLCTVVPRFSAAPANSVCFARMWEPQKRTRSRQPLRIFVASCDPPVK
jgi:hypothetical protein